MKALILDAEKKTATVQEVAQPVHGPDEVLVKVEAVALNPVDALFTANPLGATGRIVGSDFAGTVVSAGVGNVARGRRVAGFLQGACSRNERPGAFAEYVAVPADLVWQVPGTVSAEEAAAVSVCGLTAAQGVFFRLGLESPFTWNEGDVTVLKRAASELSEREGAGAPEPKPFTFFIYGASTSIGMYAAQLVRRSAEFSGRKVTLIGAASRARFPLLQAEPYGYDALVDYRDADWPEQVRRLAGPDGGVDYVFDCISDGDTVRLCSSVLRTDGHGGITVVRSRDAGAWQADPGELPVEPIYGAVWEGLGADIEYPKFVLRSSPAKRAFAAAFYKWLSDGGRLQANPVRRMPGGLERIVEDGFALLGPAVTARRQDGSGEWMRPISAEKVVYTLGD